jgi:inner membrane protein
MAAGSRAWHTAFQSAYLFSSTFHIRFIKTSPTCPTLSSMTTFMKGQRMHASETIRETANRIGRSATFKLAIICALILVLLIPVSMVKSLIREREWRQQGVVDEINAKWGRNQTIAGPILSIPYKKTVEYKQSKQTRVTRYLHLLPDRLQVASDIIPQVRYRGIYQAVLYQTQLVIEGRFPQPTIDATRIPADDIMWGGAFVALGISDMRGIRESIEGSWDDQVLSLEPGVETADVIAAGVSAPVSIDDRHTGHDFRFVLNLNGSQQLSFTPVGRVTSITARSPWSDPSFTGAFLPVERTVSDEGFTARWNLLHLNRNYPQRWTGSGFKLDESTFGVRLFSPVDAYQKSMRTAKYALMFIVFAFMAFFLSEVINRLRVHPVQYLLIGLAIILFYTLLLSFSEHTAFGRAYLIASTSVVALITAYAKTILKSTAVTAAVGGILVVLYGYLYILLQLVDYALLMGSIGLFVVLALVMYLTRKIDWYGMRASKTGALPTVRSQS